MRVTDYLQQFADPDPAFTPAPGWWWSGEKLRIEKLRWQMDQMVSMGIRQAVVINLAPSGTLFGSDADDPAFLSDEWWSLFGQVCDYAKQIGMRILFYDQIGFSGANFQADIAAANPEFLAQQLKIATVEGTGDLEVHCPGAGTPIAAYVVSDGVVRYVDITGGVAKVTVRQPSKLCIVYRVQQAYDLFSRAACERLLDTVHRQFEKRFPQHIGSTIVGSFQDELPNLPTWGSTFAETFAASFGYRLEECVHRLFEEGDADSRRTRIHFHQHRANLAQEAFFKPCYDWHEKNGLRCGIDQQSPAREGRALGAISKYADYLQTHQWYGMPGSDLHGNARIHSSIAFVHGRERVWLEGFHTTGWGGTIADTFDWLLPFYAHGANFYNPHAIYYSTVKGWWDWAPPSTCWRQPYARYYKPFAEMIARLQKLLSRGVQQASVAVLFPTLTVQSAVGAVGHFAQAITTDLTLHEVIGSIRWHEFDLGPLDRIGLDYHLLDERTIAGAAIEEDALVLRDVPMRILILPAATVLDNRTVDQILQFARAGGRVIVVGATAAETLTGRSINWASVPNTQVISTAADLPALLADIQSAVRTPVPSLHRRDGDMHILFVPAAMGRATEVKWAGWNAPMEQTTIRPDRYQATMDLHLPTPSVAQYDPRTGKTQTLVTDDGKLTLDFDGAPFAVLLWSDVGATPASPGSADREAGDAGVASTMIAIEGAWESEYLPTMPETFADIYDPKQPALRWPHTTEFEWRIGNEPAKTVRATFGPRAWLIKGETKTPIEYSPLFGIQQDLAAWQTLGPKAHVPEEFIDLGKLTAGETATIRTGVISPEATDAWLVIGANARKHVRVNGRSFESSIPTYADSFRVSLEAGRNDIEIVLTAERNLTVRAYWYLSRTQDLRPDRVTAAKPGAVGTPMAFFKSFTLDQPSVGGELKVSTAAVATVWVDGVSLGRQGGFDPYRLQTRGLHYTLPPMEKGTHQIRIETIEAGAVAPVMVDARLSLADGTSLPIRSDADWWLDQEGGEATPVKVHLNPEPGGAAWHLYRRPHPLPRSDWLDDADNHAVLQLPLVPPLDAPAEQTLEWIIPPGATTMHLQLADATVRELTIDGTPLPVSGASIPLPSSHEARRARLTVRSHQLGGALLERMVTYDFGRAQIAPGSWPALGLRSYSGAMRMQKMITLPQKADRITLDLGQVRGTVEVRINGVSAGIAFIQPYRFDLTSHARPGENQIELIVTNTLANHQSTWSPTRCLSPDQLECGVLGPISIRMEMP